MDILIKGMEMPKDCHDCKFLMGNYDDSECRVTCFFCFLKKETICEGDDRGSAKGIIPSDCPLVALPEHRRLVSAEDFIDSFEDIINECRRQLSEKGEDITVLNYFHDTIVELMGYMPTVLEATE